MHTLPVEKSVGCTVVHDMTKIEIEGGRRRKYVKFPRGHIVCEADIPELIRMGKRHILVMEPGEEKQWVFEEEAAALLARRFSGVNATQGETREGKIELFSTADGVTSIPREAVELVNRTPGFLLATLHSGRPVKRGECVAGVKIVPLYMPRTDFLSRLASFPERFLDVLPYRPMCVSIIVTGNEVYEGLVEDAFTPLLRKKLAVYPAEISSSVLVPDEASAIVQAIFSACAAGSDIVLVTGGMSVDPDDRSPIAIRLASDDFVKNGGNALPGAMTVVGYKGETLILGIPGGSLFAPVTLTDLLLPRAMAGERFAFEDLAAYGYGGLCAGMPSEISADSAFGRH